ncbi:unnamed protein product [Urochloa decumbens]|uniref:non-specific serine/threonine protein kinase n=1 Tax=Urochloa decumbens TaxID=240449 RepID=A0ABC8VHX8_9POAL
MTKLLHTAQCGGGAGAGGNGTVAWTCFSSTPPDPSSAAAARGQGQFMMLENVDAAGCEDVLTAAVYGDTPAGVPSVEFGVAEMGWWVNGSCADAAAASSGRCAVNSTCHDVETPSGAWGHRCACPDGMTGDGYAVGDGCYYGDIQWRLGEYLPPLTIGLSVALLTIGVPVFLWKRKRQNTTVKMWKTRTKQQASSGGARLFRGKPVDDDLLQLEAGVTGPRQFSYDELAAATGDFSDDRRLGSGGFGSVYRGFMEDKNRDVAVKRVSKTSRQGWKEFVSEVSIISRLRHRNLVRLIGWCHSSTGSGDGDDELLLVYELMHNGSLDAHLYRSDNVLTWPVRCSIALGVGTALLYLHEEAERRVVHRDVKPSNVMLDASFTAKLGDFGLARLIDDNRRSHTTGVAGTMGVCSPGGRAWSPMSTASAFSSWKSPAAGGRRCACGRKTSTTSTWCNGFGTHTVAEASSTRPTRGWRGSSTTGRWRAPWSSGSGARTRTAACARPSGRQSTCCGSRHRHQACRQRCRWRRTGHRVTVLA